MISTDPSSKADIVIAGGGIAGLTATLLLADTGLDITLLEPYPMPDIQTIIPGNHTSAIMNSATDLLARTGAWDDCAPYIAPLKILRIIDDSTAAQDSITADFASDEIGQPQFGMNTPNNVLRAALAKQLKSRKNITLRTAKLVSLQTNENCALMTLDDDTHLTANLVIGADGRCSKVRSEARIHTKEKDYGQKAIICRLNHTKPHRNISTEFHRPSGPFTLVPLPGKASSLVWVDSSNNVANFIAMNKTDFTQAVQDRTRGILGTITLQSDPQALPLKMMQAQSLVAGRIALIAEAAHVLHPLGAQGLNLSLRDVETLVEIITDAARLGLDYGSESVLKKYQAARRQDIQGRIWGTDGLTQMLCTDSALIKSIRRRGLKAASSIPPLKRLLMQEGLAPNTSSAA